MLYVEIVKKRHCLFQSINAGVWGRSLQQGEELGGEAPGKGRRGMCMCVHRKSVGRKGFGTYHYQRP
jgi:hypothetical protein